MLQQKKNKEPIVQEVAIYFEYQLYRANRTTKISTEDFEAFKSFNYPTLAEAGIDIKYNYQSLLPNTKEKVHYFSRFENAIAIIYLFPGMDYYLFEKQLSSPKVRALVLLTFGAGNAPTNKKFLKSIENAVSSGKLLVNTTQCNAGSVDQGKYETSAKLKKFGVISARDMTIESVLTKLMMLLAEFEDVASIRTAFLESISGEI